MEKQELPSGLYVWKVYNSQFLYTDRHSGELKGEN